MTLREALTDFVMQARLHGIPESASEIPEIGFDQYEAIRVHNAVFGLNGWEPAMSIALTCWSMDCDMPEILKSWSKVVSLEPRLAAWWRVE